MIISFLIAFEGNETIGTKIYFKSKKEQNEIPEVLGRKYVIENQRKKIKIKVARLYTDATASYKLAGTDTELLNISQIFFYIM